MSGGVGDSTPLSIVGNSHDGTILQVFVVKLFEKFLHKYFGFGQATVNGDNGLYHHSC